MKKWLPILLAVLMTAGAATACSSGNDTSSSSSSTTSSASASADDSSTASSTDDAGTDTVSSEAADTSVASHVTQDPELLTDFVGTWEIEEYGYFILNAAGSAGLYESDGTPLYEDGYYSVDGSRTDITFNGITESATLDGDTITLDSGSVYTRVAE